MGKPSADAIERGARAFCVTQGYDPDEVVWDRKTLVGRPHPMAGKPMWMLWQDEITAVIEAING